MGAVTVTARDQNGNRSNYYGPGSNYYCSRSANVSASAVFCSNIVFDVQVDLFVVIEVQVNSFIVFEVQVDVSIVLGIQVDSFIDFGV